MFAKECPVCAELVPIVFVRLKCCSPRCEAIKAQRDERRREEALPTYEELLAEALRKRRAFK